MPGYSGSSSPNSLGIGNTLQLQQALYQQHQQQQAAAAAAAQTSIANQLHQLQYLQVSQYSVLTYQNPRHCICGVAHWQCWLSLWVLDNVFERWKDTEIIYGHFYSILLSNVEQSNKAKTEIFGLSTWFPVMLHTPFDDYIDFFGMGE